MKLSVAVMSVFMVVIFPVFCLADALKLGVLAPLAGDFATYGEEIRKGVEAAKAELHKEGIESEIYYSDTCFAKDVIPALESLKSIERIDGVAANFCLAAIPAAAGITEREKLPFMHTAVAASNTLTASSFILSTNIRIHEEARSLAVHARKDLKAKTAAVMFITTEFGSDYDRFFTEEFEKLGGRVLSHITTAAGINDFKAELVRVKAQNPDVILLAHLGKTLGVLLKQMDVVGIKARRLGTYETEDPGVIETAGGAANGIEYFVPVMNMQVSAAGDLKSVLSRNAFDGTIVLARALSKCRKDRSCTRRELISKESYNGASGTFSLRPDALASRDLELKHITDMSFRSYN